MLCMRVHLCVCVCVCVCDACPSVSPSTVCLSTGLEPIFVLRTNLQ